MTLFNRLNTETEHYHHLGGMTNFGETFTDRIHVWLEQNKKKVAPSKVDGAGEEALKAQLIIEAAIESFDTGRIVQLA